MRSFLYIVHLLWAGWMVTGVLLAVAGFLYPRFWRMTIFRTSHLAGLLITASTPLWNQGICPLTEWEGALENTTAHDSFLIRIIGEVLYWEVSPWILSVLTAVSALFVLFTFVLHPPWRH